MNRLQRLAKDKLITSPSWLPDNTHYLVMMGSVAYGVSDDTSDMDIYGWAIPPVDMIFPHLRGEILGFGSPRKRFDQYQQHHITDPAGRGGKGQDYDFTIYGIVKYFNLVMTNNPNMVDSLFVPERCVLHQTRIAQMVRMRRPLFLHKGCWHKFKGYAYSQLHKLKNKNKEGKRQDVIDKYGYDTKFAYHVVRLLLEVEQILESGTLDLECNSEVLKAIRRGEWSEEQVHSFFHTKEQGLEELYNTSTLPYGPDEERIKGLLLDCLEDHYGSLDNIIVQEKQPDRVLDEIMEVLKRHNYV